MIISGKDVRLSISINHYTPQDIQKFIDAGFDGFELYIPPRLPDPNPLAKSPAERRRNPYTYEESMALACRDNEQILLNLVKPLSDEILRKCGRIRNVHIPFGGGWDIAHFEEKDRQLAVDGIKNIISLTSSWNVELYIIHGCLEPVSDEQRKVRIDHAIKSLKEIEEFAVSHGSHIALEDLPRSCLGNNTDEMKLMSEEADVGICFDVNHLLCDTHENFMKQLKSRIITTHLSDYDGIDERHWIPGKGIVPWKMIFEGLESIGYKGPYNFELGVKENGDTYSPEEIIKSFSEAVAK